MKVYKTKNYIQGQMSFHIFEEQVSHHNVAPHTHEFAEIIYISNGNCIQNINNVGYSAHRGDMFFINRGGVHSFSPIDSFNHYTICFSPEILINRVIDRQNAVDLISLSSLEEIQGENVPLCKFSFDGEERFLIEHILYDMHTEYVSNNSERSAILESYMTVLIAKILRKMHDSKSLERKDLTGIWSAISEFIEENLNQRLTLEDLAQQCFYNPSYFSRTFKQKFGLSPKEYIMKERAYMAAKILADTNVSIEELAERCGFGDKSGLYRAFEKHFGCSPTEYRKSLQNKD